MADSLQMHNPARVSNKINNFLLCWQNKTALYPNLRLMRVFVCWDTLTETNSTWMKTVWRWLSASWRPMNMTARTSTCCTNSHQDRFQVQAKAFSLGNRNNCAGCGCTCSVQFSFLHCWMHWTVDGFPLHKINESNCSVNIFIPGREIPGIFVWRTLHQLILPVCQFSL